MADTPTDDGKKGFWHAFGLKLEDWGLATLGAYLQGKGAFGGR